MRQTSCLIRPAQCREQQRLSSILFYLCRKLRNWNSGGTVASMLLIIQWSKLSLGSFSKEILLLDAALIKISLKIPIPNRCPSSTKLGWGFLVCFAVMTYLQVPEQTIHLAVKFFTKDKTLSLWNCSSLFPIPHFLCGRRNCTVIFNTQQSSSRESTQAQFCSRQYKHVFVRTAKQKLITAAKRICNDLWNYSLEKKKSHGTQTTNSIADKKILFQTVFLVWLMASDEKYYSSIFFQQKYLL